MGSPNRRRGPAASSHATEHNQRRRDRLHLGPAIITNSSGVLTTGSLARGRNLLQGQRFPPAQPEHGHGTSSHTLQNQQRSSGCRLKGQRWNLCPREKRRDRAFADFTMKSAFLYNSVGDGYSSFKGCGKFGPLVTLPDAAGHASGTAHDRRRDLVMDEAGKGVSRGRSHAKEPASLAASRLRDDDRRSGADDRRGRGREKQAGKVKTLPDQVHPALQGRQ
jgi:hypothetical protein